MDSVHFSIIAVILSQKLRIEILVQWPMVALAPYTQSIAVTSALLAPQQSTQAQQKGAANMPHCTLHTAHCTLRAASSTTH